MKQVQLINVKNNEIQAFPVRKSVAEFIESLNITDNSLKTIEAKVAKAIKNDDVLYEVFKVIEITDQPETIENIEEQNDEPTENEVEPKTDEKVEEKPNKRRNGKAVEWYKDGKLQQTFPSIKACATHMKEVKELKGMPFTKIMKSIREGIDWENDSFKFAE